MPLAVTTCQQIKTVVPGIGASFGVVDKSDLTVLQIVQAAAFALCYLPELDGQTYW